MESWSLGWPAPAKLNLMLRIVGRRSDGYHLLQTVFQIIDRADLIDFRLRGDRRIERVSELPDVPEDRDLVVRAAKLLQPYATNRFTGVDIRIRKNLPMGGGLGGGSSDAATTLLALNRLWDCGLSVDRLAELGLELGADVPVFVHGASAWAEGVGERLQSLDLPETWFLVLVPPCHVSTAAVFSDPELTRNSEPITIRAFVAGDTQNDCLPVVVKAYPEVSQAIDWLGKFSDAKLTGTGACVFAAFPDRSRAEQVLAGLPEQFAGFVARGCNRSPVQRRLLAPV